MSLIKRPLNRFSLFSTLLILIFTLFLPPLLSKEKVKKKPKKVKAKVELKVLRPQVKEFLQKKQFQKALKAMRSWSKKERKNERRFLLGQVYFGLEKYNKAKNYFKKLLKDKDYTHQSHFYMGVLYFKKQQYQKSRDMFQKAKILTLVQAEEKNRIQDILYKLEREAALSQANKKEHPPVSGFLKLQFHPSFKNTRYSHPERYGVFNIEQTNYKFIPVASLELAKSINGGVKGAGGKLYFKPLYTFTYLDQANYNDVYPEFPPDRYPTGKPYYEYPKTSLTDLVQVGKLTLGYLSELFHVYGYGSYLQDRVDGEKKLTTLSGGAYLKVNINDMVKVHTDISMSDDTKHQPENHFFTTRKINSGISYKPSGNFECGFQYKFASNIDTTRGGNLAQSTDNYINDKISLNFTVTPPLLTLKLSGYYSPQIATKPKLSKVSDDVLQQDGSEDDGYQLVKIIGFDDKSGMGSSFSVKLKPFSLLTINGGYVVDKFVYETSASNFTSNTLYSSLNFKPFPFLTTFGKYKYGWTSKKSKVNNSTSHTFLGGVEGTFNF